jgi:hypothetical protein
MGSEGHLSVIDPSNQTAQQKNTTRQHLKRKKYFLALRDSAFERGKS